MLVATRNAGKLRELAPMIAAAGFAPRSLDEAGIDPRSDEREVEAFATFEENAVAKARYYLDRATAAGLGGCFVLADDSGLAVDALGGAPGVRSKRWGGNPALNGRALDANNNARLLATLEGVADRRARFVCVAAVAWMHGVVTARGEATGLLLGAPRGAEGFGYDPLFLSDDLGRTLAEVSVEEKSKVSHRARAVATALAEYGKRR